MKKHLLFSTALCFVTIFSNAQISKGSTLIGGDFRVFTNESKLLNNPEITQSGLNISPVIGKAIKDNLFIGIEASFGFVDYDNDGSTVKQKDNSYGFGFFIRKYKPVGKEGFYLFIQGKLAGTYSANEIEEPLTPKRGSYNHNASISFYPGIAFAISKRLHLESGFNNLFYISYYNNKIKDEGLVREKHNGFEIRTSLTNAQSIFYVGLRFFISGPSRS